MFFNTGKFCLGFKITDPGIEGKPKVGLEHPDWMKRCGEAGFAEFVARELVTVDGKEESSLRLRVLLILLHFYCNGCDR